MLEQVPEVATLRTGATRRPRQKGPLCEQGPVRTDGVRDTEGRGVRTRETFCVTGCVLEGVGDPGVPGRGGLRTEVDTRQGSPPLREGHEEVQV